MPDLYQVLGLSPRASEEDVKAAYRALAKRAHPDVNAGNATAEVRTKEINRAYETLRNAETRAAYDTKLARRHASRRRRFRIGASAFMLAVAGTLGAYWARPWETARTQGTPSVAFARDQSLPQKQPAADDQHAAHSATPRGGNMTGGEPTGGTDAREGQPPPPPAPQEPGPRDLAAAPALESALHHAAAQPPPPTDREEAGRPAASAPLNRADETGTWVLHRNARLGFELRYPAHVFAPSGGYAGERLRLMVSRDSRAVLGIFFADGARDQLAAHRRALIGQRYAGAAFDDTDEGEGWFTLSGTLGAEAFYEHVGIACDGRSMAGWQVVYPLAERAFYAGVVEEMRRSYRQGRAQGGRCGEPASRVTDVKRERLAP